MELSSSTPRLSFSIADIPLGIAIEEYFLLANNLKVGLEVALGFKTRFRLKKLMRLSKRYNVTIYSIHQPAWSVAGWWQDEKAFYFAKKFNALYVAHPLVNTHINSPKSKAYYKWLSEMKTKYDLDILIENMTNVYQFMPLIHFVSKKHHDSATDVEYFDTICKKYNFGFTLDISHLMASEPQKAPGFNEIFPYLKNIHLSDYNIKKEHMGLGDGLLNYQSFLSYLKEKKYRGLINLELCPRVLNAREKYYRDIAKSVKIVREYFADSG